MPDTRTDPTITRRARALRWVSAVVALLGLAASAACGGGGPVARVDGWLVENARTLPRGSLVVGQRAMTDAELVALLEEPEVGSLVEVLLDGNLLGPDAARALVASPKARALEVLQIGGNRLGDAGLQVLAGWDRLPALRGLYLADNGVGPVGVRVLAGAGLRATDLELGFQPLGDVAAPDLARLRVAHLRVPEAGLGGQGAAVLLARSPARTLILDGNQLGGLPALEALSPALGVVSMKACGLGPADAEVLAAARAEGLTALVLARDPLGDDGIRALAGAAWLGQLVALDVTGSGAGPEARAALRRAWGDRRGLTIE